MTKNGMRAFAAGMILTCAIIAFFYYFMSSDQNTSKKAADKPLTDAAVEDFLAKKGQIAVDQKTFNKWQKAEQDASKSKDSDSQKQDNSSKADDKNANQQKEETAKVKTVTIKVKSGMTSTDIANELEDKKFIKDSQALVDYIVKHKLEKYIQLGSYKIKSDMTIAEIAKTIAKER